MRIQLPEPDFLVHWTVTSELSLPGTEYSGVHITQQYPVLGILLTL